MSDKHEELRSSEGGLRSLKELSSVLDVAAEGPRLAIMEHIDAIVAAMIKHDPALSDKTISTTETRPCDKCEFRMIKWFNAGVYLTHPAKQKWEWRCGCGHTQPGGFVTERPDDDLFRLEWAKHQEPQDDATPKEPCKSCKGKHWTAVAFLDETAAPACVECGRTWEETNGVAPEDTEDPDPDMSTGDLISRGQPFGTLERFQNALRGKPQDTSGPAPSAEACIPLKPAAKAEELEHAPAKLEEPGPKCPVCGVLPNYLDCRDFEKVIFRCEPCGKIWEGTNAPK